eukprot:11966028-Alexandrium_andersonii.AAC.1
MILDARSSPPRTKVGGGMRPEGTHALAELQGETSKRKLGLEWCPCCHGIDPAVVESAQPREVELGTNQPRDALGRRALHQRNDMSA